jgi:hypothetical protein
VSQKTPITIAHGNGIGPSPKEFGDALNQISYKGVQLSVIDNRGTIVRLGGTSETFVNDSFRVTAAGHDIVKTETLRTFDGQQGFTLAQGQ